MTCSNWLVAMSQWLDHITGHFLTNFTWFCMWIWGVHPYRQPQKASGESWTSWVADIWHEKIPVYLVVRKIIAPPALFNGYLELHLTYMKDFYIFKLSMSWACWKCPYFLILVHRKLRNWKEKVLHVLWDTLYISIPQDGRQTDNMVLSTSGVLYHGNLFEPIIFGSDSDLIFFLSDSRLNTDMIQNFWAITWYKSVN